MMTFEKWMKTMPDPYQGTQIDRATQEALFNWFRYRQVCDDNKFGTFYRRKLVLLQDQYYSYLRVATTMIDPMVGDYMERLINDTTVRTNTNSTTETTTHTNSQTNSETHSGADTTKTSDTATHTGTRKNDKDSTTTPNTTTTVTNNTTTTTTGTSSNTTTNNLTDTTQATGESSNTNTQTTTSDTQELAGATPDSALYPAGGFPESLAWKYASSQGQNKSAQNVTGSGSGTTTDNSTVTHTGTVGDSGSTSGEAKNTGTVTTAVTGTDTNAENSTETLNLTDGSDGTATTTYGMQIGNTVSGESGGTAERTDSGEGKDTYEHKERYSGRHEAPQDMLKRARDYIVTTNAFAWFIDKLEDCFYMLWEASDFGY